MSGLPSAAETYVAEVAAITARIEALETLKTQAIEAATANVAPELVSESFRNELGRPYDAEVSQLVYLKNVKSIAFAESFLSA